MSKSFCTLVVTIRHQHLGFPCPNEIPEIPPIHLMSLRTIQKTPNKSVYLDQSRNTTGGSARDEDACFGTVDNFM